MRTFCVTKFLCYLGGKILFTEDTQMSEFSEDKKADSIFRTHLLPLTFEKESEKRNKVASLVK